MANSAFNDRIAYQGNVYSDIHRINFYMRTRTRLGRRVDFIVSRSLR